MSFKKVVSPKVFSAIQTVDIESLSKCRDEEIRPILPCLVRMSLISPLDTSNKCSRQKIEILTLISGIEYVNSIVALLSIDFHALESDVRKEQLLRMKSSSLQSDSVLISNLQNGLALEYERSDMTRRLRLVLSELLFIQTQLQDGVENVDQDFHTKSSELFDNDIYVEEISDIICIALAELPMLLNVQAMSETLLHVHNGPSIICRMVANFPDSFREVSTNLIQRGEKQEENSQSAIRCTALSMLSKMNPSQALAIRSKCVEFCRMPALAITLSLDNSPNFDQDSDMVPFVSGLLLGNDQTIRNWFALFIRTGQKRKGEVSSTSLQLLRDNLLSRLQNIIRACPDGQLLDTHVVQASSLLRLYCALRGIAAIKFQDEEVNAIVQLLTSHPSPTPAGVRFASLGLCMIIACPLLVAQPEHEKRSIDWVQWLVREEAYFESASGVSASFGEMLLLMAIHFHSNQLSAICDLVCATLGMKIPIRHNNMTRMKQIFTQEIFTEQVVTSHAVKVPVTLNLNANMMGFLPVHCIHQLLKSRAFSKHNVNIKSWIYKQICASTNPLHPVLPSLVEVYVTSILSNTKNVEAINKPLSENEIRRVFQSSIFGQYFDTKRSIFNMDFDVSMDYENVFINETSLTPQLLLLYYLLLYEDCRLTNAQNLTASRRKIKIYSAEFMSELPIKYLLHHAQKDQGSYSGLFGPLLKLLATHFLHLTLVEDWLDDMSFKADHRNTYISEIAVVSAFNSMESNPSKCARMMQQLLKQEAINIWPFAEIFMQFAIKVLDKNVPRYVQDLYKEVWLRLNTVLPRRLWVLTVKNIVGDLNGHTRSDVADDPLQIMRCDERVFRCAPIYSIILRVLRASLASSRSQLFQHLQSNPKLDHNGQIVGDSEREEMCRALVAVQRRRYNDRGDDFPKSSKELNIAEVTKKFKHELTSFCKDRLSLNDTEDFWKFFHKYQARQTKTSDFDKTQLLNITFASKIDTLYDQLPMHINREVFRKFLDVVSIYQDFQQKLKFNKLKKLRAAQNDLPIAQYKETIIETLKDSRVVLIAGDTGCGKSTQVPQYVIEAGYNKVVCTQPRRIACVSLAKRVAYETLTDFKSTVGYQIRFEKTKRADTSVIFMTEGLLLRQAAEEETINAYDVIILDEIHERHLFGDFLIGIMKCLLHKRDNFKLILMSATINIKLFESYFSDEGVKVIQVPGRLYPIEINYKPILKDPYERKTQKFDSSPYLQIVQMIDEKYPPNHKGDLLIFLNGISEITALSETITEYSNIKQNWIVLQLHSTLSLEEQDKVFDYAPEGMRKCIISTNIAETSVTIDGVRFVIDSGKVNKMMYHTSGGISKLTETNISQDSAKQRSGRAGRTGPGICYRMYSEDTFNSFDAFTTAEIHLVPLESLLLHMISLGLGNIQSFPFLEKPSAKALEESIEKLKFCGALKLNEECLILTSLGEALSRLPVELTIGKMLILSTVFGNVNSVLAMAAILSIQSPLTQQAYRNMDMETARKPLESNHGDPISILNMYKEWLCIKQETAPASRSSKQVENSKVWAKKRGLEEQRFYEVTKLIQQFRDILEDAQLMQKGPERELSSGERSIRHGELKQLRTLRRTLKEESRGVNRKQLKYNPFNDDSEEKTPKLDLRDIEFRITNDFKKLQKLLDESSPDSYKDLMMLKLIITSGLYPQVAIEDEFNHAKSVSERLYHTKNKNFVFLRPLSCFTTNPEILEIHADDIEVPPPGYFSKRPISRKHQVLVYQSILETKKDSAAVQMLLETCLETKEDRELAGQRLALQEVRSLVCCYIHQVFMVDTNLAKLVHFQSYQSELLEVTVKGVPSMHICSDFILELMQQPSINKQIFAIQLLSHLSVQYALPKNMNLCITALNLLYALMGAISGTQRNKLFKQVLPSLVKISEAFPSLIDEIIQLLIQFGRICKTESSLSSYFDHHTPWPSVVNLEETVKLTKLTEKTFIEIISKTVLRTNIY